MNSIILTIFCIIGFIIFSVGILYVAWVAHQILDRICVKHARRFCTRHGFKINRVRWQMEFEQRPDGRRGPKTENTLVQLDCFDQQKQRKLVLLRVWPLGVRKLIRDDIYPETYDSQWPQDA